MDIVTTILEKGHVKGNPMNIMMGWNIWHFEKLGRRWAQKMADQGGVEEAKKLDLKWVEVQKLLDEIDSIEWAKSRFMAFGFNPSCFTLERHNVSKIDSDL